ncbi:MAG: DUF4386 domain-containing protein [Cyclobacteriaceae bacterium]|nr:DUF4386 domain-containing protein [Cyclobacteriaceae bacterium]
MNSTATIQEMSTKGRMSPLRKTALVAGVIYLLTFISIPTLTLYIPIHDPAYILGSGSDSGIIIGTILEIIVALGGIGTAVVLYPVLRKQNESAAMGLVGARILEASTIFVGIAFLLAAVKLKQSGAGPDAVVTANTMAILYDRIFLIGQSFIPAVDDLLLGFLLLRLGVIPKTLAWIGIVGGFLLPVSDVLILFNFLEQRAPESMVFAIPVAVFEFSLGLYLIFNGFRPSPKLS